MKWLVVMSWLMVCNACWAMYFVTGAALTDVGAAADIVVWSAGRAAAT